jgi:hypothetical protein
MNSDYIVKADAVSGMRSKMGTKGHLMENWVYYVGGATLALGGLYQIMNYYGVYGESDKIYKYFGLAMLVLLVTYMNDYSRCNGYGDCVTTTYIFWILVVVVLLFLVGFM